MMYPTHRVKYAERSRRGVGRQPSPGGSRKRSNAALAVVRAQYMCTSRAKTTSASVMANQVLPDPPAQAGVRRRWAELLRRIFEVDPLRCPRCGEAMRIVGFITQPPVIDRILTHLRRQASPTRRPRAPPHRQRAARAAASA